MSLKQSVRRLYSFKVYQQEQKESQIQVEELKRDVQRLKQELDKRCVTVHLSLRLLLYHFLC